jgi:hypothetical protein
MSVDARLTHNSATGTAVGWQEGGGRGKRTPSWPSGSHYPSLPALVSLHTTYATWVRPRTGTVSARATPDGSPWSHHPFLREMFA